VIVLDEPTAGVDVELRQGLWQFVRRLNKDGHTIVLTTHYLEEAQHMCARIAMLKAGRIVAMEPTRDLLARVSGVQLALKLSGPFAGAARAAGGRAGRPHRAAGRAAGRRGVGAGGLPDRRLPHRGHRGEPRRPGGRFPSGDVRRRPAQAA